MRASLFFAATLTACAGGKDTDTADGAGGDVASVCSEPAEVTCVDQMILDLSLHDDKVSEGEVTTTADGDDFVSTIDATAGGYNSSDDNPWVYVRFTEDGAERVDIDDETALESMDWDMSLRRFIIRLNGGSSGPSCVGAASFLESSYDDLVEVPDGISYVPDSYYSGDCTIINDSSGLPDNPQVALSTWWSYESCVQTTGVPHLIQLADGNVLKLVVEAYYGADQETCNSSGSGGDDSAVYTMRWTWMTR